MENEVFGLLQFSEQLPIMDGLATELKHHEEEVCSDVEVLRTEASRVWRQITKTLRPILRNAKLEDYIWKEDNVPGFYVALESNRLIVQVLQCYQENTLCRDNAFWLMNPDQINALFNNIFPKCISDISDRIEQKTKDAIGTKKQVWRLLEILQTQYLPFYSTKDRKHPSFPLMQKVAYVINSANSLPNSPQKQALLERASGLWQAIKTNPSIRKARIEDQDIAEAEKRTCRLHLVLDEVAGDLNAVKEVRKRRGAVIE